MHWRLAVRAMSLRDRLSAHVARCLLLPDANLPVHCAVDADLGRKFWFEQRYWLQSIGIKKPVDWRKQEKRRGVLDEVRDDYRLIENVDVLDRPNGCKRHLPLLLSSRGVLAWLATRWALARRGAYKSAMPWRRMLCGFFEAAQAGLGKMSAQLPSICLEDVVAPCQEDGSVNIGGFLDVWPTLRTEWDAVSLRFPDMLYDFPSTCCVSLQQFFTFVESRLRYSIAQLGASPLHMLRVAIVEVVAFLVEIHVHYEVLAAAERNRNRDWRCTEVFGPSNRCRQHSNVVGKKSLLQRMRSFGSDEVATQALTGNSSVASQAVVVRTTLYSEAAAEAFRTVRRFSVGWDGSTHGGKDVICGYAMAYENALCVYMQPEA